MSVYKGWPDKVVIRAREKQIADLESKLKACEERLAIAVKVLEQVYDEAVSSEYKWLGDVTEKALAKLNQQGTV